MYLHVACYFDASSAFDRINFGKPSDLLLESNAIKCIFQTLPTLHTLKT